MSVVEYRHRITINRVSESKDSRGTMTEDPPTLLYPRVPAFVQALTGHELERARQVDPRISWSAELRYLSGVKAQQQVIYHAFDGDRTLEVVGPPVIKEKARTMMLMCREATT